MNEYRRENKRIMANIKKQTQSGNLSIPLAIFVAGIIIVGAIFSRERENSVNEMPQVKSEAEKAEGLERMNPVSGEDHIFGNPDAPVKIVEYSDFECPACKLFQTIMMRVMDDYNYGKSGKVAWVYRHFPIDLLHPLNARKEAIASECAAELGGNESFWKFANRLFELSLSDDETDIKTVLPQVAREIGLDETKFFSCIESGKYEARVQKDISNAEAAGGRGTPWSIIVAPSGKKYPLSGVWPETVIKQLVDRAIKDN